MTLKHPTERPRRRTSDERLYDTGFTDGKASVNKWQPIETAPKDGTSFLAAIPWEGEPLEILRMRWDEIACLFGDATYAPFIEDQEQPTHWMPLPPPPKEEER